MTLRTTLPLVFFAAVVGLAGARVPHDTAIPSRLTARHVPVTAVVWHTGRDSTALFTAEQATAGEALFKKTCAECHEKKDMTSADFRLKWSGKALYELYELTRTTMPDNNPGALSRDDYAAALAYILQMNGLPAGPTAIMPDTVAMRAVKLNLAPQAP